MECINCTAIDECDTIWIALVAQRTYTIASEDEIEKKNSVQIHA
jgi:hypothetical protein